MKWISCIILILFLSASFKAEAAAKKKSDSTPFIGKKVIALAPIRDVQIQMPDQSFHNFGEDFQTSLSTQLTVGGKYTVVDTEIPLVIGEMTPTKYQWPGTFLPAATVKVEVEALNFLTGYLGDQMFYGFDERFRTPFNDGFGTLPNEFPLRSSTFGVDWFGNSFDQKGTFPFDSHSGLNLGDGFNIDILYASMTVKYARYHSELHLKLELTTPLLPQPFYRSIQVKGDGFFFDVSGAYQGYSAGISVARRDAMNQGVKNAISGAFDGIDRALSDLPLMANIDFVLKDGTLLLGTGPSSEIPSGTLFQAVENPKLIIQVDSSVETGSIGHVLHGELSSAKAGYRLHYIPSYPNPSLASNLSDLPPRVESVQLPAINLPSADLSAWVPVMTKAQVFAKSLAEAIFLPYRIWRYFNYDQTYHSSPDWNGKSSPDIRGEKWAHQIGLDTAPEMAKEYPRVAIIDSGVDYNHPLIHGALWLNPSPSTDVNNRQDRYGWDFISQDSRPYDDGYHGTQVASVILNVAPNTRIIPIKIFNPWGITSSAAIYAAFVYAVDHGAHLVICSWSTSVHSRAIEMGVAYAQSHGVPVVASAGDQGLLISNFPVYPAVLSKVYDNVVTVTAVNSEDRLIHGSIKNSNYDPTSVQIAAPGENIPVVEPRLGKSRENSSDLAAAIVAGVLSRGIAADHFTGSYKDWIHSLLTESDSILDLTPAVKEGLRVHVRR